jgi:hypothetical protein
MNPQEQPQQNPVQSQARFFRIGDKTIVEDESTRDLGIEAVRSILMLQYPQVENAQIVEQATEKGIVYNFMPIAGRKG